MESNSESRDPLVPLKLSVDRKPRDANWYFQTGLSLTALLLLFQCLWMGYHLVVPTPRHRNPSPWTSSTDGAGVTAAMSKAASEARYSHSPAERNPSELDLVQLNGFWSFGDASIAVNFRTVPTSDLPVQLRDREQPLQQTAELRGIAKRFLGITDSEKLESLETCFRQLSRNKSFLCGVSSRDGSARLKGAESEIQSAYFAWSVDSLNWHLVTIQGVPLASKLPSSKGKVELPANLDATLETKSELLFDERLGVLLGRRWTADGRLSAELRTPRMTFEQLCQHFQKQSVKITILSVEAHLSQARVILQDGTSGVLTLFTPDNSPGTLLTLIESQSGKVP